MPVFSWPHRIRPCRLRGRCGGITGEMMPIRVGHINLVYAAYWSALPCSNLRSSIRLQQNHCLMPGSPWPANQKSAVETTATIHNGLSRRRWEFCASWVARAATNGCYVFSGLTLFREVTFQFAEQQGKRASTFAVANAFTLSQPATKWSFSKSQQPTIWPKPW